MAIKQTDNLIAMEEENQPKTPEIVILNLDLYADAITRFKGKIVELVQNKTMSEQTATRIILEQEYNFFQQITSIEYKENA